MGCRWIIHNDVLRSTAQMLISRLCIMVVQKNVGLTAQMLISRLCIMVVQKNVYDWTSPKSLTSTPPTHHPRQMSVRSYVVFSMGEGPVKNATAVRSPSSGLHLGSSTFYEHPVVLVGKEVARYQMVRTGSPTSQQINCTAYGGYARKT